MVYDVREITAKKFCKYAEYVSFEYLLFLFTALGDIRDCIALESVVICSSFFINTLGVFLCSVVFLFTTVCVSKQMRQ